MSRAQLKSGDISLGLAHEWICAFGRQGGTATMLQQTLEDVTAMQRIIDVIKGEAQTVPEQNAVLQALMAAVEKGVIEVEKGVYEYEDPGFSLIAQANITIVREKDLMRMHDWCRKYNWARQQDAPQTRRLRIPVEGSFNQSFPNQKKFLLPGEKVPPTRIVTMFLVIYALATGIRLLPDSCVRCLDKVSGGCHVFVGHFTASGLGAGSHWDDGKNPLLGLAALRKS